VRIESAGGAVGWTEQNVPVDIGIARERFAALMARPDAEVPLWEATALIAAFGRPRLDLASIDAQLDELATYASTATFADVVRAFVGAGFRGNTTDYGAPVNSYLDRVLERRLGIPITLAVVAIEMGRRRGVAIEGIGLPNHFMVRSAEDSGRYFDPFHGVAIESESMPGHLAQILPPTAATAQPVVYGPRAIAARMLRNLEAGPAATDYAGGTWFVSLHKLIPGLEPAERVALARRARAYGDYATSVEQLTLAAAAVPDAQASQLLDAARADRARAN
jgi:regulator of sirC expression with transglutaminase-like and TPR domain